MSKIHDFLTDLSKREIAFLMHYKFDRYTEKSRSQIDSFVESKGYLIAELNKIVESEKFNVDFSTTQCPRCGSRRSYTIADGSKEFGTYVIFDPDQAFRNDPIINEVLLCQICDYDLNLERNKSWINRLIERLGLRKKNTANTN